MADEIKQVLGIDATKAIEALQALDQHFQNFDNRLRGLANDMNYFNSRSGKAVTAMKQMSSAAKEAAAALSKVNKAQSKASASQFGGVSARSTPTKLLRGEDAAAAMDSLLGIRRTSQEAANAVIAALRPIGSETAKTMAQGRKALDGYVVSWETLSRVVMTQFIVRAMSMLRDMFKGAAAEAIEFQRAVARVETIAGGVSFGNIADEARRLSDQFNIPLLETVEGVYKALSNQVGDFGDSIQFSAEAAKFAKATNASLAQSIDLLSGALKSFNLGVEQTGRVASVFFTAIYRGRITAEELSETFGRVGPQAGQLGIDLEETAGALAEISIKGLRVGETLTQFRGIMTALAKPTEAMKQQLQLLGFASVEQAVATLRLDGLLEALAESADGSSQAFARLFPNVRGLGGAISLTGDNLKSFARNVREGREMTSDFVDAQYGKILATDAEQVTAAYNKLKNALVVEFGQGLLEVGRDLLDFTGGVENLIILGRNAVPGIVKFGLALASVAASAKLFQVSMGALAANPAWATTALVGAAITAAPNLIKTAMDKAVQYRTAAFEKMKAVNDEELANLQITLGDENTAYKRANEERVRAARQTIQEIGKSYFEDVARVQSSNDVLLDQTKRTLDKIVDYRSKLVGQLRQTLEDSDHTVRQSQANITRLLSEKADLEFNSRLGRGGDDPTREATQRMARAQQLAAKASEEFVSALRDGDKVSQDLAKQQFDAAQSQLKSAESAAQRTGKAGLERKVLEAQQQLLDRRIDAENQITKQVRSRENALRQELKHQEDIEARLREQAKIALDNTGAFGLNQELFSPEDMKRRDQRRQDALKEIAKLTFTGDDAKRFDALGFKTFIDGIQRDLTQEPVKLLFDVESSVQRLKAEMERSLAQIDTKMPWLVEVEDVLGRRIRGSVEDLNNGLSEVLSKAQAITDTLNAAKLSDESVSAARKEFETLFKSVMNPQRMSDRREGILAGDATAVGIEKAADEMNRLARQTTISDAEVKKLQATLQQIGQSTDGKAFGALQVDLGALSKMAEAFGRLKEEMASRPVVPEGAAAELQQLDQVIRSISGAGIDVQFQNVKTVVTEATSPVRQIANDTAAAEKSAARLAGYYERMANSAEGVAQLNRMFQPQPGFARGGTVSYFESGGLTRGTDVIPAMLSRGETVFSKEATQRFFSQLQAINAGRTPVFRQDGGTTNIGDINVNVKGGDTAKTTARQIALELRREIRRGTSRF